MFTTYSEEVLFIMIVAYLKYIFQGGNLDDAERAGNDTISTKDQATLDEAAEIIRGLVGMSSGVDSSDLSDYDFTMERAKELAHPALLQFCNKIYDVTWKHSQERTLELEMYSLSLCQQLIYNISGGKKQQPLHISLVNFVHNNLQSRVMIDILNGIGVSSSYSTM